jgi:hypothetical protein
MVSQPSGYFVWGDAVAADQKSNTAHLVDLWKKGWTARGPAGSKQYTSYTNFMS